MCADKEIFYFPCEGEPGIMPRTWKGKLRILKTGDVVEAEMEALGSYCHLIIGSQVYGNFLCIPNWGIGVAIAGLDEYWWNKDRLQIYGKLSAADACSVATALNRISRFIKQQRKGSFEQK